MALRPFLLVLLGFGPLYCVAQGRPLPAGHEAVPPVPLVWSANPRLLKLAAPATIYRQLRDTSAQAAGRRVQVVQLVNRRSPVPGWVVVNRARSAHRLSADTTTYFLRLTDIKAGSTTSVLL